ncbi:hypothetical protein KCG44_13980 [Pacificimonas sp. WHA3]|uniref:asparagine synthase (glutamine-hydrolyzing) n=1 Tax=Pacificimonas pallii TaxID=2827236 RepID=A0ABS6SHM5_9SPHN|nr:asparagine synthase-related protein [Pacificimonas pallii]MBV7257890.1 hypothetical protein [Pacificimonas pallii]
MSGFAGYRELAPGGLSPQDFGTLNAALRNLSRDPADEIRVEQVDTSVFATYVSTPADGACRSHNGGRCFVAGDPVVTETQTSDSSDLNTGRAALAIGLMGDGDDVLHRAKGEYSAAALRADGSFRLAAGHVGTRPIHIYHDDHLFAFASNLRTLMAMLGDRLKVDPVSAAETLIAGQRRASNSPYLCMRRLRGGETITASHAGIDLRAWFHWSEVERIERSFEDTLALVERRFLNAVRRRLRDAGKLRYAALSGGLDSRLVVLALRELGEPVRTMAVAPPRLADHVLSIGAAQAMGTDHHIFAVDAAPWLTVMPFSALVAANLPRLASDTRDQLWLGDGGSVLCGHIYMTPKSVAAFGRRTPREEAARRMQEYLSFAKLLPAATRDDLLGKVEARLVAELTDVHRTWPDARLRMYLLRTDQETHCDPYYENIDIYRAPVSHPFFDADYIRAVFESPIEHLLLHRLQNDLLRRLNEDVWRVPWQVYPGHLPGPTPVPDDIVLQWDKGRFEKDIFLDRRRSSIAALGSTSVRGAKDAVAPLRLKMATALAKTPLHDRSFVERLARYARDLKIVPHGGRPAKFGADVPHDHHPPAD